MLINPSYTSIKYKAVISFSSADNLWDEWERIYTELDNSDREADALRYFNEHKSDMLAGTEVLWEEKNSYYDLMKLKLSEGDASFNS